MTRNVGVVVLVLVVAATSFAFGRIWRPPIAVDSGERSGTAMPLPNQERTSTVGPELEAPKRTAAVSVANPDTPALTVPTTQLDVAGALAALDRVLRANPVAVDDENGYAAKYEGTTLEGIYAAMALVKKRVKEQEQAIIQQRLRDGLYEEEVLAEGEEGKPVVGNSKGMTSIGGTQERLPNGMMQVRTVKIPAEEYPEFHLAQAELWWLMKYLRSKGASYTELMR